MGWGTAAGTGTVPGAGRGVGPGAGACARSGAGAGSGAGADSGAGVGLGAVSGAGAGADLGAGKEVDIDVGRHIFPPCWKLFCASSTFGSLDGPLVGAGFWGLQHGTPYPPSRILTSRPLQHLTASWHATSVI